MVETCFPPFVETWPHTQFAYDGLTGHVLKDPEFTLKFHRGDLFAGTGMEQEAAGLAAQQRAPVALDASVGAVLAVLEKAGKELA